MDMHGRGFGDAAVLSVYWQNWLVSRGGVPMTLACAGKCLWMKGSPTVLQLDHPIKELLW